MTLDPDSDRLRGEIRDTQTDIFEYPSFILAALVQSCQDVSISKNPKAIVTS